MNANFEAERSVIGSVLLKGGLIHDLKLKSGHFADEAHQRIFKAMKKVQDAEIDVDIVSVATRLGDDIERVGGVSYLSSLAQSIPSTESLHHHEKMVMDAYKLRTSAEQAMKFSQDPSESNLTELIHNLKLIQDVGVTHGEKDVTDYLQEIVNDMISSDPDIPSGMLTGYREVDNMTGGLQKTDLNIVAGRPGMGKTAYALNIGAGHCKQGGVTSIFSLEMGARQLLKRMISAEGNIDGQKWRTRTFSTQDYDKAMNAVGEISNWNLYIHERARTLSDIRSAVRKVVRDYPDEDHVILIDYLQLITPEQKESRRDLEVSAITRALKLLAMELDVSILLLSQLSRGVETRQDKRPMLSDLRDSGAIEQDADGVQFLYRDDYYDAESESQNIIEIIFSKQRSGPVGAVELAFIKEYGKFVDLDHRYSDTVPS